MLCCRATYNYLVGNPISTYGENLLVMVQIIVIIMMMWRYATGDSAKSSFHVVAVSALYGTTTHSYTNILFCRQYSNVIDF